MHFSEFLSVTLSLSLSRLRLVQLGVLPPVAEPSRSERAGSHLARGGSLAAGLDPSSWV